MWLGNSAHHLDFPGTMSAAPRTYIDLVERHGRELPRARLPPDRAGQRPRRQQRAGPAGHCSKCGNGTATEMICSCCSPATGDSARSLAEIEPSIEQQAMGHACEWETSMILALGPALGRRLPPCLAGRSAPSHEPALRAWTTKDRSAAGHVGDPAVARLQRRNPARRLCRRRN